MRLTWFPPVLAVAALAACSDRTPPIGPTEGAATRMEAASIEQVAPQNELVFTPSGWYHRSCVHEVPDSAHISRNGTVTRVDGSSYGLSKCQYPGRRNEGGARVAQSVAPVNDGWMEYASETLSGTHAFHGLTAEWEVPPSPVGSYSGVRVYYTFPGLQSSEYIIQPVLQYGYNGEFGGSSWVAASWHCNDGSDCLHSSAISVSPGDDILGTVTASDCQAGECLWTITSRDLTTQTQSTYFITDTGNYWLAVGGAVEVNDLSTCSQYPVGGVFYSGIALHDENGAGVSPSWSSHIQANPNPECDFDVSFTTSSVNLYHNPPPAPSVSIDGLDEVQQHVSCMWTSNVSGGVGPYTYVWQRDGLTVSTTSSYSTSDTGTSDFQLYLEVTDANEETASDSRIVTVAGSGQFQCQ